MWDSHRIHKKHPPFAGFWPANEQFAAAQILSGPDAADFQPLWLRQPNAWSRVSIHYPLQEAFMSGTFGLVCKWELSASKGP
jgi:hypothetical protein